MLTTAEIVDGQPRDIRHEIRDRARLNPFTGIVIWSDGSSSFVHRAGYLLHDIGTRARMERRCLICGKNESCQCPESRG